ncbi:uncharacterized protein J3D65DRAFT_133401 [Phyllosticta citribraziliensis]|uniref:Uncharacterized protein n=1 Tax=Phyllosticta citribraziliensis TaxID=989973 RepID=A0ABR1L629_9PEZI
MTMLRSVLALCALSAVCNAIPAPAATSSSSLKISRDGTCGGSTGNTCSGSSFGPCCSQYGWCGKTTDHCAVGCNSLAGTCTSTPTSSPPKSSSSTIKISSSSTTSSKAASSSPVVKDSGNVSKDGSCGGSGKLTCLGSGFGDCCSQYGWCGSGTNYCSNGCQSLFGTCGSSVSTSKPVSSPTTSTTSASTSKPATSTPTGLADCLGAKNVPVSFASSSNFAQLSKPYNLHLPYTPAVIVIPTTVQHVSDAVVCAGQYKVKVQAKSGGHSYASFSSGGKDGSMIIDLQSFQNITLNGDVAVVGGGVRLGNLAQGIYNQNKRALSHGTCPGVGIGGHFTHGGYGYSSRAWGLAMDQIVGLDVVLANGTAIKTTSTAYPDIYWALRGAADSIGVITNFYLKTQAAPATVINWSYSLPNMFADASKTASYFQHIQDFAQNSTVVDRKLGLGMYMDGEGFSISGTYFGTQSDFESKIAPELLRTLPKPSSSSVKPLGWIDSLTALGGASTITVPTTGYDSHDNFFAKSVVVPQTTPLTAEALTSYFSYMINTPAPTSWYSIINLYGGPDSQINVRDSSFAAYSDRSALWVAQHYAFTSAGAALPSGTQDWVAGLNNAMESAMPDTDFTAYLNYVDPSLSAAEAHDLYYGDDVYSRLTAIKSQVDPQAVFWNPQAIGN